MTMPHLMNCPHKGGTWCLKCVGEEWDRREAERDALNARIAELERRAKAFDAIASGVIGIGRNGTNYRQWCAWSQSHGGPDGKTCIDTDLFAAIEAALAAKETTP